MARIRKLLLLPSTDRRLLFKSVLALAAIRAGLWLLPFRFMYRAVARISRTQEARDADDAPVKKISWAIRVVSNNLPFLKNCLSEALTTQVLLGRMGFPSSLRIGVARSESGQLKAHAWVEAGGRVIVGGAQSPSHFIALPPLEKQ